MTRLKRCGKLKKLLRQQEKHSQTTALFDKRRKAQQIETVRFDLRGGTAGKGGTQGLPKSASEAHFLGKRSKPGAGETFALARKRTSGGICDEVFEK